MLTHQTHCFFVVSQVWAVFKILSDEICTVSEAYGHKTDVFYKEHFSKQLLKLN
jgi:hypothetical protein